MSINKHEQVTQEKIGMAHGGPSFALRLKTHKVKFFQKRFDQEILKSTHLANHRNNPLISTWLLYFKNYDHPNYRIKSQNPISICYIESKEIFLWISYETYCLKVSLSKKLILSQFSQKEITIYFFLNENKNKKLKNRKKKSTYSLFPPHLFQKSVLDGLILGRKRKIVTIGSIWPYVKIYFL